jgi:hypothetical protein
VNFRVVSLFVSLLHNLENLQVIPKLENNLFFSYNLNFRNKLVSLSLSFYIVYTFSYLLMYLLDVFVYLF